MVKIFSYTFIIFLYASWESQAQSNITFPGAGSAAQTTKDQQAIYQNGGESLSYRMTECEKGLDFTKKELQQLKEQVSQLQARIQSLEPLKK